MSAKTYQDEVAQEVLEFLREDVPQIAALIRGELGVPGSPAYVRRLRDQAAVAALSGVAYMPSAETMAESVAADRAIYQANALVLALGYQVPEDTP